MKKIITTKEKFDEITEALNQLILKNSGTATFAELDAKVSRISVDNQANFFKTLELQIEQDEEFKKLAKNYDVAIFTTEDAFVEMIEDRFCPLYDF